MINLLEMKRQNGYTPMFIAALFIIAKTWKQPRCPSADEWIKSCDTCIQWNATQP